MAEKTVVHAVIEIGSTAIRILVVEVINKKKWKQQDYAESAVNLGQDVSTESIISRESLLQCILILKRYKEIIKSWHVPSRRVHVLATSPFRTAKNRDAILDRIAVKTGFKVTVLSGIEENRLLYTMVRYVFRKTSVQDKSSLILDVGGGSTEIMLLYGGQVVSAHSFRIGTVIFHQQMQKLGSSKVFAERFLEEYIQRTCDSLNTELDLSLIENVVLTSNDMRIAARAFVKQHIQNYVSIGREDFLSFAKNINSTPTENIAQDLNIGYNDAESVVSAALASALFLQQTSAVRILIPALSIREGVIISKLSGFTTHARREFDAQIIASAKNLGARYLIDKQHSEFVAGMSVRLFDFLKEELGLTRNDRLLLEVAGLLHDVGHFIQETDHHLHGQYIVEHSDIFGISREDLSILSNVIRYHRGKLPEKTHIKYGGLSRKDRTRVLKLAALLRVADALDRGHCQHIHKFSLEINDDILLITMNEICDISLEQTALQKKALLFESIFGYKVILV